MTLSSSLYREYPDMNYSLRYVQGVTKVCYSIFGLHSRSGETVDNWVGNQLAAGCDTRLKWGYFQFLAVAYPESKSLMGYYSTTSGGLAIGHVFGSPSKATDTCVYQLQHTGLHQLKLDDLIIQPIQRIPRY